MPILGKVALLAIFAAMVLSALCESTQEVAFMKSFLAHAAGLDHKALVLAAPVVKLAALFVGELILAALMLAMAMGKSWARKTCILLAVVECVGAGCTSAVWMVVDAHGLPAGVTQDIHPLRWWAWTNVAIDVLVVVLLFTRNVGAWYREDASIENKWKNRLQCLVFWMVMIVVGVVSSMVQGVAAGIADPKTLADKFPHIRVAELKARADRGDSPAMWRLGNWERNGWLGEKHPDKAVEWYKKAAALGDRFALNDLGDCYEKGIGTETNMEEAVSCWMKAAEKRHGWAACKVAIRLQKDKKQTEAFEWFRKSAEMGNGYGCCKLGECYEKGWGAETNAALAAEWFLKGAERRHGWGMEKTGDFYRDGYGVEKDLDKAREWYERAVDRGNKTAQKKLDALPKEGQDKDR